MSQTKIEISNLSDSVIAALSVPKITVITYPGNDTAANPSGGQQITLTGSGFSAGAIVNIAGVPVAVSSVVNGNTITFTSPAKATGSYAISVINVDGGIAVSVTNIAYSGVPAWSTSAGSLATVYESNAISNTFSATSDSAVTYTVTSGSLPAGGTLNSSTGALTGTASSVESSTTYSFTIDAIDAELQETPRNFSYTINPDVVTWGSPANGVSYSNVIGDVFTQALSATSAAGKAITYTANALPAGLSISGANISGTFSTAANTASLITATAATTNKTATRTLNWAVTSSATPAVEYLVVAGGGGSASKDGDWAYSGYGGGGAGGLLTGNANISSSITYAVTIGAGGAAGPAQSSSNNGYQGANSIISGSGITTITSIGGGGGGGGVVNNGSSGGNGGSGGGLGDTANYNKNALPGRGVYPGSTYLNQPRQGYDGGGYPTGVSYGGGPGGGGAGGSGFPGQNDTGNGGAGGPGLYFSISGANTAYAGGGGGGSGGVGGAGGVGGGGQGANNATDTNVAGTVNTGGGGGAASITSSVGVRLGKSGGSGIVILRYADTYPAATATTGTPIITNTGGYRIYQFTSSGSITF